jgi:hypothetical protein
MGAILLRKVAYKLPGPKGQLRYGVVICENEGCALLFVKSPDEHWPDSLVLAAENVGMRYYEDVEMSRFPVERGRLMHIGARFLAIGEGLAESDLDEFFKADALL